jgi:AcrR family transcriptional regulator
MPSIRKNPATSVDASNDAAPLVRRRMPPAQREQQLVEGAIRFFSKHGLNAQLRDLARELGITHTLLYHYFPTKQALLERVYKDIFEGRWRTEWETLLDDKTLCLPDKLTRFYVSYARVILEPEWVRVFVYSGLNDRFITDRYFALLREKLFPRIHRETLRYLGSRSRKPANAREMERILGLHGSVFYMGMRRWVYGLGADVETTNFGPTDALYIEDRVKAYLASLPTPHLENVA